MYCRYGMDTTWMRIASAEMDNHGKSPRIGEYLKTAPTCGLCNPAWCSAFANWVMEQAGFSDTNSLGAKDWLKWGISLSSPRYGAITVLKRVPKNKKYEGWEGHVGFFVKKHGSKIHLLGGNQSNQVKVTPFSEENLLGYRWPWRV